MGADETTTIDYIKDFGCYRKIFDIATPVHTENNNLEMAINGHVWLYSIWKENIELSNPTKKFVCVNALRRKR